MSNKLVSTIFSLSFIFILINACTTDKLPEPSTDGCDSTLTYNNQIQDIIDGSCAIPGCHTSDGLAPGNYETYASTLSNLESGLIKTRVVDLRDMPIAPGEISDENFEKLKCWLELGFPE